MSISETFQQLDAQPNCKACAWLPTIPKAEQDAFQQWARRHLNGTYTEKRQFNLVKLHRLSQDMGLVLGISQFREHVREHVDS